MSQQFVSWFGVRLLLLALLSFSLSPSTQSRAWAQDDSSVILPPDTAKLKKQFREHVYKNKSYEDMVYGKRPVDRTDEEAVDIAAQWFVYRFTWEEYQSKPGEIQGLMVDLDRELEKANKSLPANDRFVQLFHKKLVERSRDLLRNEKPIARVNGSRILARLAGLGSMEAGDVLSENLGSPQQTLAVKYFALQGLKNLLKRWYDQARDAGISRDQQSREDVYAVALAAAVQSKPNFDVAADTPPDLIRGFQIYRREAIRALAWVPTPAVSKDKKTVGEPGRTAQVLLRVVAQDKFAPPLRLDDQVEAAIGVARKQVKLFNGYQPDAAAYVLAQFASRLAHIRQERKEETLPLKIYAARLIDAYQVMLADVKNIKEKTAAAYVKDKIDNSIKILKLIKSGEDVPAQALDQFDGSIQNKLPTHKTIYQGVADSGVNSNSFTTKETDSGGK